MSVVEMSMRVGRTDRKQGKVKKKVVGQPVVRVQVADLRRGDRIATVLRNAEKDVQSVDDVLDVLQHGFETYLVAEKSTKIENIDLCPGQWRTHVHINKSSCYDERQFVYIVA